MREMYAIPTIMIFCASIVCIIIGIIIFAGWNEISLLLGSALIFIGTLLFLGGFELLKDWRN